MLDAAALGKLLILIGIFIAIVGGALLWQPNLPFIGRLPGDILIKRDNVTIYIPIATSLILSLVLTLLFNLFSRR